MRVEIVSYETPYSSKAGWYVHIPELDAFMRIHDRHRIERESRSFIELLTGTCPEEIQIEELAVFPHSWQSVRL